MDKNVITVEQLENKFKNKEKVFILDVRDEEKFQTGSLQAEAIQPTNIPYVAMRDEEAIVKEQVSRLPKETVIVTVCTTGNKAGKAASLLREKGFNAVPLEGGLTAWKEKDA
ncbi:rhodanese-like domain-containing protein [Aneurinibacillus tyrosinisolvens]|jgi:rhodanese-related sulfurtransferase|uniref:rhodanese-like domain-containing protein n=1 Tax=Aneurinibacillus tyrosinisolvens TaxID=1443435 RepID=UPI00063F03A2|nr:rhodanese-like domain-containing protein [Aneurinibacillus tyrosinisolvens]